jgi:hypothetical protein
MATWMGLQVGIPTGYFGVGRTYRILPGRLAKTPIDFPEAGRHNRNQTLEGWNRFFAFPCSRRVGARPPGFCVPK